MLCLPLVSPAGTLYLMYDSTNTLDRLDPSTLSLTVVGSTGVGSGDFGDLAYDPASRTMYWVPGRGNDNLYTINLATGLATLVGSHGIDDLFALAYDSANGELYGQSGAGTGTFGFYQLNPATGSATYIGSNGVYPGGMTYNSTTGQLILTGAGNYPFSSVDPSSGAATALSASTFINDNGVTYDADRNVYWTDDWSNNVFEFDAGTFSPTSITTTPPVSSGLDGIAYVSDSVPEPGTTLLIAAGLALMAVRRRRA